VVADLELGEYVILSCGSTSGRSLSCARDVIHQAGSSSGNSSRLVKKALVLKEIASFILCMII
jgi:hypothetical protein